MKFNLKQFIVKNRTLIIAVCVCIAVFAAAFFAGGDLSDTTADVALPAVSATDDETGDAAVQTNAEADGQSGTSASSAANSEDNSDSTLSTAETSPSGATYSNSVITVIGSGDTVQTSGDGNSSGSSASSGSQNAEKSETAETSATQDKYKTDPTPTDKPQPVEPQQATTTDESLYCTFTITCETILDNMDKLSDGVKEIVPSDGIILKKQKVKFTEGESVYTVLVRVCKENNIHLETTQTPAYNSAYIEGIANIYEFDCGSLSGWTYKVNGWVPNYGCSRYQLEDGDDVIFCYTCDLGKDVGSTYTVGD